jgi:hypothetical protein
VAGRAGALAPHVEAQIDFVKIGVETMRQPAPLYRRGLVTSAAGADCQSAAVNNLPHRQQLVISAGGDSCGLSAKETLAAVNRPALGGFEGYRSFATAL